MNDSVGLIYSFIYLLNDIIDFNMGGLMKCYAFNCDSLP
jgi:hypothetical protein